MQCGIRGAHEDELDQISQLEKDLFGKMSYPLFMLRQFYDIMPETVLVSINNSSEIIGFGLGVINLEKEIGWILCLPTRRDCHCMGVGRSLCDKIIEPLKSKGAKNIYLTVHQDNKRAIQFYDKLGFETVDSVIDDYRDGEPRLVMRLKVRGIY